MKRSRRRRSSGSSGLSRQALERLALGLPVALPPRKRRSVRTGPGRLRRSRGRGHRAPAGPPVLAPAPSPATSPGPVLVPSASSAPLVALVVGRGLQDSAAAADAAVEAAARLANERDDLVLADLAPGEALLSAKLGAESGEGLADVLLFGTSLARTPQRPEGVAFRYLPMGVAPDPSELPSHPRWSGVLREAQRRGITLLVRVPGTAESTPLLERASAAILLIRAGDEEEIRSLLPEGLPVHEVVALPAEDREAEPQAAAWLTALARLTVDTLTRPEHDDTAEPAEAQLPAVEPAPAVEPEILAVQEPPMASAAAEPEPVSVSETAPPSEPEMEPELVPVSHTVQEVDPEATVPGSHAGEPPEDRAPPSLSEWLAGDVVEPAADPAPPAELEAPRARGMTLAQWIEAEEARLRGMDAEPEEEDWGSAPEPRSSVPEPVPNAEPSPAPRFTAPAQVGFAPPEEPARAAGPIAPPPSSASPEPSLPALQVAPAPPAHEPAPPVARRDGGEAPLGDGSAPPPRLRGAGKYAVPRTTPRRERAIRVLAVLILSYWAYYIVWRWTSTMNWDAAWFSVPLALAETWGLLSAVFLVLTTWKLQHRTPRPAPPGLSVDVFITTYDEPLEIIRRTAISAREIRYPHRTYVLDDGRRDEVRAMAEELGVEYLRRGDNEHAKAGNLNHALRHTRGDFILQLDADHAPLPQMLDRLLGFFDDPRVAFVQTPQDFYNKDSFTTDVDEGERRIWEEQRLFFSVIQPGKDYWNAAFFCGSCAVMRRSALEEIGGFSTHSVTEDIETSLRLHARGWKSVYYGESLAYGLAAGSAVAFHTQHLRWAQGAMQVLRELNPLRYPGLTPAQRIGYFYSLTAYVGGVQKLIFYAAPVVFFLTGVLPIQAVDRAFLLRFVPYLILTVVLVEMLSRGLGFTWITERYQMAKFWTYTRALPTYFTRRRLRFNVTPKGPGHVPLGTYLPHLLLMVVTVLAADWATLAYHMGWIDYGAGGWGSLAFQLNFLWAVVNFALAAYVVRLSLRMQQHRQDHRFADRFPIHLRPRGTRGRLGERQIALTEDLNASGLSFRSVSRFTPGTELKLTLPLSTREVAVNGVVVHARPDPDAEVPIFVHGVEFREVPLDVRDAIELHCAQHAVPIEQMKYRSSTQVLARAQDWVRNARGEPRRPVRLPTWVLLGGARAEDQSEENVAFLEEISRGGARLILDRPVAPGTHIVFEVPGTSLRGEGVAIFSRALETPIGVRFAVGMRRESGRAHDTPSETKMRLPRLWRTAGAAAAVALAMASIPAPGAAQIQPALYGTAEGDTQDFSIFLLGLSVAPAGLGLQPTASVTGYRVTFPVGAETSSYTAVVPAAGLRYQWPVGAITGTVGYQFLLEDQVEGAFGAPGGAEQGVTTTALADYWGDGRRTAQLIATYGFGDQYLWARGRAAHQVLEFAPGSMLRLGLEAVGQGGGDEPGASYSAFQLGPVAELQLRPGLVLIGSAGGKSDNLIGNPKIFPYFKFEFVVAP